MKIRLNGTTHKPGKSFFCLQEQLLIFQYQSIHIVGTCVVSYAICKAIGNTLTLESKVGNVYVVNWKKFARKSRKLFGPEKAFVKLRPVYSVKLVFSFVVRGMKIKINAKFRASRRLRFEDTKRTMLSPEKFRDFRERGPWSDFLRTFPRFCFSSAITARIIYIKRLFFLIRTTIILFCH